ncbi:unnamed protein product [Microthlaspi erraticum]|uniref:Retrotransposon gag domain-containing protein n=1 Tax=Microthlaspi erraticum TaxID=1685480 RepID=A0A6D2IBD7_9BRAS|nr:unnamed protein product [Microthlaspi erraticum]
MINLVQNKMFNGLPSEDPIDHLDEFDRLCDLTKINGVSEDAIKLRLFPMSLADKAHQWEKSLPHGTITSWDECKKAFLAKFFSTGRTTKLRSEISGFTQRNSETFAEAWKRFKGYTSQCPHHGFNNESLLSTLYRGCLARYREILDRASNGKFLNQDIDDGWQLVENIAISTESYGEDYDRTDWSSTEHSIELEAQLRKDMHALHSKLDKLILAQFPAKQVNFISGTTLVQDQEGEEPKIAKVPTNNKKTFYGHTPYQAPASYKIAPHGYRQQGTLPGFSPNFMLHQQNVPPGFPPIPYHTPPSQDWDMEDMLQQLLQGQANGTLDMNNKLVEIDSKIESLTSRVQMIESSSASSSSSHEYAQAVILRSGRQLPNRVGTPQIAVDIDDEEGEDLVEYSDIPAPNSIEPERNTEPELDRASEPEPPKPVGKKKDTPSAPPPYKPPLPFLGRFKKQLLEKHKAKFEELIKDIELKLPFIDALMLIPPYQKFLKDAVLQRTKEVQGMVILTRECSAIIQQRVISEKKEDPGSFTLPCMLGPLSLKNSLCDLGTSVSLIPLSVAKRLGYHKYQACGISLVCADRSIRLPTGMFEDLPLRIGNV